jgi:nitrogen fixation protein NifB
MLPQSVDEIAKHNIDHVTITINCVDPDVGAKIYPWIFWNNKRIMGREGAAILIEQQQKGLEACIAKGILVKVNSVMIPGVNDEHLKEVSRVVKSKGAFLHNVMPLIAEAEHGTFYGLTGQRSPTQDELQALQDACAGDMNMMRHCRQCRADAVGLLGEDRGSEFTLDKIAEYELDLEGAAARRAEVRDRISAELEEKRNAKAEAPVPKLVALDMSGVVVNTPLRTVKMAVATSGGGLINQHFGHAKEFLIYEASGNGVRFVGHRKTDLYCGGGDTCGDTETTLEQTIKALEGCEVVLCSKIGYEPWGMLEEAGIAPNGEHAMEGIEDAVMAVYAEMAATGKLVPPLETPAQSAA